MSGVPPWPRPRLPKIPNSLSRQRLLRRSSCYANPALGYGAMVDELISGPTMEFG